ncbi:DUF998 domain-containing protein [Microlunatus flavus]|uniref:DUF998 domain-containing protein n=1 Tax=Microlunatus flavus TaxID=1036181 RepID=A0A1H9JG58_9ACTN|nr:DUF998 domain-containing protein [Microlunatus flavus]SEQ85894.1 Protein of unknown function [Microlunatus flavus]
MPQPSAPQPSAPQASAPQPSAARDRTARALLVGGVLAGPFYVLASLVHGWLSEDVDLLRDSWSLLSLGPYGWVHVVVFLVTGLLVIAAGLGLRFRGRGVAGPALVAYGALLVVAGLALPDAPGAGTTVHGVLHLAAGGLGFVAFVVAAVASARRFARQGARGWAAWSLVAAVVLLAGFAGVASGSSSPAAVVGLTVGVVLSDVWLTTASLRAFREAGRGAATP